MKFYLQNGSAAAEEIFCENSADAFTEAQNRNRKDTKANWKAYTERGDLICGLFQHGENSVVPV